MLCGVLFLPGAHSYTLHTPAPLPPFSALTQKSIEIRKKNDSGVSYLVVETHAALPVSHGKPVGRLSFSPSFSPCISLSLSHFFFFFSSRVEVHGVVVGLRVRRLPDPFRPALPSALIFVVFCFVSLWSA